MTRAMTLRLPDDLHEGLRQEAFDRRTSITALIVERLSAPVQAAEPECTTCGGKRLVSIDRGMGPGPSEPCPDCSAQAAEECLSPPARWRAGDQATRTYTRDNDGRWKSHRMMLSQTDQWITEHTDLGTLVVSHLSPRPAAEEVGGDDD